MYIHPIVFYTMDYEPYYDNIRYPIQRIAPSNRGTPNLSTRTDTLGYPDTSKPLPGISFFRRRINTLCCRITRTLACPGRLGSSSTATDIHPEVKNKKAMKALILLTYSLIGKFFLVTTRMFLLGNTSGNFICNASNNSRDCCRGRGIF